MGRGRSAQQIAARVGRLAMQKRTMTTGKKKVSQRAAWACAACIFMPVYMRSGHATVHRVALTTDAWVQAPMSKAELAAQAHKPEAAAGKEVRPVALHNFARAGLAMVARTACR